MNARVPLLVLAVLGFLLAPRSGGAVTNEPVRVYMPDGQLQSHLLRVYITEDITEADNPTLTLLAGQLLLVKLPAWAERTNTFRELARFQHWTETVEGQAVSRTGTLLLFDIRQAGFPFFKASMRITPVIKWGQPRRTAVGDRAVYLGNMKGAGIWTIVVLGALVAGIYSLTRFRQDVDVTRRSATPDDSRVRKAGFAWLLMGPEGRLSLSKTQAAVWTVCIGGVVFLFGLIRLEPPAIPESLVALMGLSLATRVLSFSKEKRSNIQYAPQLSDLIRSLDGDRLELAITKAQMLFWTCLVACLFVAKSLLDGVLWDVPWPLVTLMGMSQATYVVPVIRGQKPGSGDEDPPAGAGSSKSSVR